MIQTTTKLFFFLHVSTSTHTIHSVNVNDINEIVWFDTPTKHEELIRGILRHKQEMEMKEQIEKMVRRTRLNSGTTHSLVAVFPTCPKKFDKLLYPAKSFVTEKFRRRIRRTRDEVTASLV